MVSEDSGRRGFVRKLMGLVAAGGIAGVLFGRQIPKVSGTTGSFVGAVNSNVAFDDYCVVTGGDGNAAGYLELPTNDTTDEAYATVGGGYGNTAGGKYSTVPGGCYNTAGGRYSFATGRRAKILTEHDGAFLFADNHDYDFDSVADNEFAVRCKGGARFVTAIDGSGNPTKSVVIDSNSQLGIGTSAPARMLHVRGNNAVARLDRDVDSASFIFTRTAVGNYDTVWKTFTFGVKATGVDTGSFFIGDMHTNVSGSSDNRILIDTTGNVGIGTTTPAQRLHVAGNVQATGFITGDITFANSYSVTEDETAGLAFKNDAGEKIAVLDREGNWHIKGDIIKDL